MGTLHAHGFCSMSNLATLSAVIERTNLDLDRQDDELRHENTDVTTVMNWIAGVRKRARQIAQNVETLELSARC
jgi:hypothetical protein